jgi:hypothetical protein
MHSDAHLCAVHVYQHERLKRIPTHLLAAISKVESGRYHPKTHQVIAWPWTINVNGEGRYFATKHEAVRYVKGLLAQGINNIDVGCMQVNLRHHPHAFPSIEAAFDPKTNIHYAAQFLMNLKNSLGSWNQAVAHYHSANAQYHIPYRKKVYETWLKERQRRGLPIAGWTPEIAYGTYMVSYGTGGKSYRLASLNELRAARYHNPYWRLQDARYQLAHYRQRAARALALYERMKNKPLAGLQQPTRNVSMTAQVMQQAARLHPVSVSLRARDRRAPRPFINRHVNGQIFTLKSNKTKRKRHNHLNTPVALHTNLHTKKIKSLSR